MLKRIKELEGNQVLVMAAESDEDWAVLNGFSSELHEVELIEGAYYLTSSITLDARKAVKRAEVDKARDAWLHDDTTLTVDGVGDVTYNVDAMTNVQWLIIKGIPEDEPKTFILADDSITQLTQDMARAIANAFEAHRELAYTYKTVAYAAITAAETSDELDAITFQPIEEQQ
ncbi:MAG: hypothetical protein R3Y56_02630 [Akkermansia sp.]